MFEKKVCLRLRNPPQILFKDSLISFLFRHNSILKLNLEHNLQKFLDDADEAKKKYYEELKIFRESDAYKNVMKKKKKINGKL